MQIAKDLEAYVKPGAACPYDWRNVYPDLPFAYNVDYNAQRLARTAINHAYWGANKLAAAQNPLCLGMQWHLSDSHYQRQVRDYGRDVCDDYAAHDEGLGRGVWPIDKLPMPHPQCLCYQTQVVPSMEDAVARLNRWLDGGHDPRLTQGFKRWRRENVSDAKMPRGQTSGFMRNGRLRLENRAEAPISPEVIHSVEATGHRLMNDFPVLERLVNRIYVQPEAGIAAFGTGIRGGIFETGIALDPQVWRDMDSLRTVFQGILDSGHTRGTDDPLFIFSHEAGHALHTALALKDIGYELGTVMTPGQLQDFYAARKAILQESFVENRVFRAERFDTPDKIYNAIDREMGWRARSPDEFIAQSVAMMYNGKGSHPIADEVMRWLKRRLR